MSAGKAMDEGRARQVELILGQVETLPALSPIATQLLSMGTDERVRIDEVTRLVESDPALAGRMLGLCRKADKGLGDRITTVRRAVIMLGLEAVRAAVLSISVYDMMSSTGKELDSRLAGSEAGETRAAFNRIGFWKHSVSVACAADLISRKNRKLRVSPDEAFVAGLLHDLGKLVLEMILPQAFARVLTLAEKRRCDCAEIERQIIGLDHFTAGRRIAQHWGLPESLQEVLWLHGQPLKAVPESPSKMLVGVVTAARAICRSLHLGWSGDFGPEPDPAEAAAELGLSRTLVDEVSRPLHEAIVDRLRVLGLDDSSASQLLLQSIMAANTQIAGLTRTLDEQKRRAELQSRGLESLSAFLASVPAARGVAEMMGEVARSAAGALGTPPRHAIFQDRAGDGWQFYTFDAEGKKAESVIVEPPALSRRSVQVIAEEATTGAPVAPMIPGIAGLAEDAAGLSVFPVPGVQGRAAFVLLFDGRTLRLGATGPAMGALRAAWSAAAHHAAAFDDSRRQEEQLAQLNRTLVEAQRRLTEAESMARLGEMTAGAAHEMNNPLTVISGRAQLLAYRLRDAKDKATATAIVEASKDLTELVAALHMIASPPKAESREVGVAEVVTRARELAAERLGAPPRFRVVGVEGCGVVSIDAGLASQALAELLCNAAEAAPGEEAEVEARLDRGEGLLEFRVADTGPGLSAKAKAHAFDPFFSDKPAGRQRGLGLAKARRIVESLSGTVVLRGREGGGTGVVAVMRIPAFGTVEEAEAAE